MAEESLASILDRACERHGGERAQERLNHPLTLDLEKLDGALLRYKGLGIAFRPPSSVTVTAAEKHVVFHDFPTAGETSEYRAGAVSVPSGVPTPTDNYRKRFRGFQKMLPWTPADVVYFFGYALSQYFSVPFSLQEHELVDRRSSANGDELWFRFGPDEDTHSRIQGYYFDPTGLLVRHDYRAEILGAIFNGAHFIDDYQDIDGVLVGTNRRVRMKIWHHPIRTHIGIRVLHGILRAPSP